MLDLAQLRCFVAVAEELHFGRGAARLNMTQPPVSRQIKLLEHAVGVVLLERTSRSVQLTHAGRVFLPEAKRVLTAAENAQRWARNVGRGDAGKIRLGFTAAAAFAYLPGLLHRTQEALPNVTLQLEEMVSRDQIAALVNDELDVGLLRSPIDPGQFETEQIASETLVLATPIDGPLASDREASLPELDGQPFVMYSPTSSGYFHDLVMAQLNGAGVSPRFVHHAAQIHTILLLVNAGFGSALIPGSAATLRFPNIRFRAIATRPAHPVELFAAWRRENQNPALPGFVDGCLRREGGPLRISGEAHAGAAR